MYGIGEDAGGCTFKSLLLADAQIQGSQGRTKQKTGQTPGTPSVSYALLCPHPGLVCYWF